MWIALSLLGAFFQSLNGAFNKTNLRIAPNSLRLIAFINYSVAGVVLFAFSFQFDTTFWSSIGNIDFSTFAYGMLLTIPFNIIAIVYGYKALPLAEYNYLAPWTTITSLIVILPAFLLLNEVPTPRSVLGIAFIVFGALIIDFKTKREKNHAEKVSVKELADIRKAKFYLLIVSICFSITPVGTKIMVAETSPLSSAAIIHLSIAFAFFVWLFLKRSRVQPLQPFLTLKKSVSIRFFALAIITGFGYAIANGSINIALQSAQVSSVMAVKRIAPMFSFFIGYIFLKERKKARRKLIATAIMVVGSILIVLSS